MKDGLIKGGLVLDRLYSEFIIWKMTTLTHSKEIKLSLSITEKMEQNADFQQQLGSSFINLCEYIGSLNKRIIIKLLLNVFYCQTQF